MIYLLNKKTFAWAYVKALSAQQRRKHVAAQTHQDDQSMKRRKYRTGEGESPHGGLERTLLPKLNSVGSLERAIHNVADDSLQKRYSRIFEGYPPRFRRVLREARREEQERRRFAAEERSVLHAVYQHVAARE